MPDSDDRGLLVSAALEAGKLALELSRGGFAAWEKTPGNPVTDADYAIDRLLTERLREARPDYGWLSEETRDDGSRLAARRTFFVDPIDGTRDFVCGRDGYAVSIAVVEDGVPRVGVLFAPARQQLFVAERGLGAVCNDMPLSVSTASRLAGARLPVDRSVFKSRIWDEPWDAVAVEKPNAIALRITKVASGEADGVFDGRAVRDLDIAAAALILTEAGGIITDHEAAPLSFNGLNARMKSLVAATPGIHAELCAKVAGGHARYAERSRPRVISSETEHFAALESRQNKDMGRDFDSIKIEQCLAPLQQAETWDFLLRAAVHDDFQPGRFGLRRGDFVDDTKLHPDRLRAGRDCLVDDRFDRVRAAENVDDVDFDRDPGKTGDDCLAVHDLARDQWIHRKNPVTLVLQELHDLVAVAVGAVRCADKCDRP